MAFVETLIFGTPVGSPGSAPEILGRSNGINQDLAEEIVRLCTGWGQPPSGENPRPVFMSFPLKSRSSRASSGANVVIKVEAGTHLSFQAVVIAGSDYAAFGYNPFALAEAGAFPAWDPMAITGRRTLNPNSGPLLVNPPPSSEDVGLIDEALHQILASHKLYLPIEQASDDSDRCLALLLEVIPEALKKQLRFASFAPSPANNYHLAATTTEGCEFSGWKRLMMTLVGGALSENLEKYVKKVRDCLAFGDVGVLWAENRQLTLGAKPKDPGNTAIPRSRTASVNQVIPAAATTVASSGPKSHPQVGLSSPRSTIREKSPREVPQLAHLRGGRRQLSGAVVALLVLVLTVGGGWTYLEFFHGGGILWQNLISWHWFAGDQTETRVASLLEVPNVGAVYNKQVTRIHLGGMILGLNSETDQRRGLVQLKSEAAVPLLQQVDLFLELAAGGIRQGKRPDRESERLRSLTVQGQGLAVELDRLELAWHSLSLAVNWRDLGSLSDSAVFARRDSLQKVSAASLRVAAGDMKFGHRRKRLLYSLEQTKGMRQLLSLFQANQWSDQWGKQLYGAAEAVSPSASPMTRAYRNSAFSLVRLKNAEHLPAFEAGAFADQVKKGIWLCPEVADILPGLRKQVGKFGHNDAPPLLAGTLALYKILEDPEPTVGDLAVGNIAMEQMHDNAAVRFDPAAYENYLQRLRYQALQECVRMGKSCSALGDEDALANLESFAQIKSQGLNGDEWAAWSDQQNDPFLKRWAHYETGRVQQILQAKMYEFDGIWQVVWTQVEQLRVLASQGEDWSAKWVSLDKELNAGLAAGKALAGQGAFVSRRIEDLQNLRGSLDKSRPLDLGAVTVRLDQDRLKNPVEVFFEFRILPQGRIQRSQPFTIGPAAPAGSGWVGTVVLDRKSNLACWAGFQGSVRMVNGGRKLLTVDYPSLGDGVGPGALIRPRSVPGGSLSIKTGDSWWRDLQLPDQSDGAGAS